jgi:hypothetical protein
MPVILSRIWVPVRFLLTFSAGFSSGRVSAANQGLTLVHFSAQLERFYGIGGARRGCVARV